MTEQEITQAREDLQQLDIEQLRCGVMLQLLKIEALTKERDDAVYACGLVVQRCDRLVIERNTLAAAADSHKVVRDTLTARLNVLEAAAKLALDVLSVSYPTARSRLRAHNAAIETLRQAGVQ